MRALDRVFGCLLILGGIGHGLGAYSAYHDQPMSLLWAWSASFAVFLLAAVNLLRSTRKHDRALAWISVIGCMVWIAFVLWFARLIGNIFDFRALLNLAITFVLALFSLRAAVQSAQDNSNKVTG